MDETKFVMTTNLRDKMREALPPAVTTLMDSIEAAAGHQIAVVADPNPPPANAYHQKAPATVITQRALKSDCPIQMRQWMRARWCMSCFTYIAIGSRPSHS